MDRRDILQPAVTPRNQVSIVSDNPPAFAPRAIVSSNPPTGPGLGAPVPGDERRRKLITDIYYRDLGRNDASQEEIDYWYNTGLDENALRQNMYTAAGIDPAQNVNTPLMADQKYSTFLRGLNFSESEIQSSLQAAKERLAQRQMSEAPRFQTQRKQADRNVSRSFGGRGLNRSSMRLRAQNDALNAVNLNERSFMDGLANQSAQMDRDAARQLAQGRRQAAEQQISARDRLTQNSMIL